MSTTSTSLYEHFFRYTSGRWLWDEESRLQERYIVFDVRELQRIAAESVGAQSCTSITKITEGGYNKVFRLVMDDGSTAIARIPMPHSGPATMTTASEVATMDFARNILNLPVPKVFAWSTTASNPVGTEYIIMEEAPGTQLSRILDDKTTSDRAKIIDALVDIEKKLLSVSFSRYGSIYFASDSFPGCEAAKVVGDVLDELKGLVEKRFVIGPVVDRGFWKGERASMSIDRGPWKTPHDYMSALASREISWINKFADSSPPKNLLLESETRIPPSHHISLYKMFLQIIPYLAPQNSQLSASTLWHWDLNSGNLFVEGDRITSIIDWQDAWAGPLFLEYQHPKLVAYHGDVILELPEDYEYMEDEDERASIRKQVEKSVFLHAYEAATEKENPLLNQLLQLQHYRLRRQLVTFASDTWDGDILPFKQLLIRVERYWDDFGFNVPCPIHFTKEEIQALADEAEGYNEREDFWDSLTGIVDRDGWTFNGTYDQALEIFAQLREEGLKHMEGDDRVAFEKETRWAERKTTRDNDLNSDEKT